MRPFETLESFRTPEGRELTLHRHDRDFYIHLDGEELMSTRRSGSESALAEIGCEDLPAGDPQRVLIGGLGLGYTLRAAIEVLPPRAQIVVAEIFSQVVSWNRQYLGDLGKAVDERRVTIRTENVRKVLFDPAEKPFHAVLLDVDNGPSEWCLRSNRGLYSRATLEALRERLVPGGVLAVWSAYSDPRFVQLMRKSGYEARAVTARSNVIKGQRHTIFLGRAPRARRRSR